MAALGTGNGRRRGTVSTVPSLFLFPQTSEASTAKPKRPFPAPTPGLIGLESNSHLGLSLALPGLPALETHGRPISGDTEDTARGRWRSGSSAIPQEGLCLEEEGPNSLRPGIADSFASPTPCNGRRSAVEGRSGGTPGPGQGHHRRDSSKPLHPFISTQPSALSASVSRSTRPRTEPAGPVGGSAISFISDASPRLKLLASPGEASASSPSLDPSGTRPSPDDADKDMGGADGPRGSSESLRHVADGVQGLSESWKRVADGGQGLSESWKRVTDGAQGPSESWKRVMEAGSVQGESDNAADAEHEDVELRILAERLKLVGIQRRIAALRCAQFASMMEASLEAFTQVRAATSRRASSSSQNEGDDEYWSSPNFYRGHHKGAWAKAYRQQPLAIHGGLDCPGAEDLQLETSFVEISKSGQQLCLKAPSRHSRRTRRLVIYDRQYD